MNEQKVRLLIGVIFFLVTLFIPGIGEFEYSQGWFVGSLILSTLIAALLPIEQKTPEKYENLSYFADVMFAFYTSFMLTFYWAVLEYRPVFPPIDGELMLLAFTVVIGWNWYAGFYTNFGRINAYLGPFAAGVVGWLWFPFATGSIPLFAYIIYKASRRQAHELAKSG